MSSLTIMDLEIAFDLLAALLAEPPQAAQVSEEELAKQREREWQENEARLKAIERRDEERYQAQMRALDRQKRAYAASVLQEREAALEEFRNALRGVRDTAAAIAQSASAAGSSFLSDYTNVAYRQELFEMLAARRQTIVDEAQAIIDEADCADPNTADRTAAALTERAAKLREAWQQLRDTLQQTGEDEQQSAARSARFQHWLRALDADTGAVRKKLTIFPDDTPADLHAAKAKAMSAALINVERYLYSPDSAYLTRDQKAEVARLYGVDPRGGTGIPEEDAAERNLRFETSMRRGLDRQIFEMRTKLRRAWGRYIRMCERLGAAPDDARLIEENQDSEALLAALNGQIEQMERRFAARARREVVQAVVDSAIRSARRGLSVRQLEESETQGGNWSAMYQIGHSGTTLEVYADARGQISIETGAILADGEAEPTAAQSRAIERNNQRFCTTELPDIVERLREELAAAGDEAAVSVREMAGPERVRIFREDRAKGAIVLQADGSAARAGDSRTAARETKYLEADS